MADGSGFNRAPKQLGINSFAVSGLKTGCFYGLPRAALGEGGRGWKLFFAARASVASNMTRPGIPNLRGDRVRLSKLGRAGLRQIRCESRLSSSDILRFGALSLADEAFSAWNAAQRTFCAAAMRFRAARLNTRFVALATVGPISMSETKTTAKLLGGAS
jgi:hypothetical protein